MIHRIARMLVVGRVFMARSVMRLPVQYFRMVEKVNRRKARLG